MRYFVLFLLHVICVIAALASMVVFAVPKWAGHLPLADIGLFFGLAVYWFLVPAAISVVSGVAIDTLSRSMSEKNYYSESNWSGKRKWFVVRVVLGAALIYLHFWLQPAVA